MQLLRSFLRSQSPSMSISFSEAAALRKAAQRSVKPRVHNRTTAESHRLRAEALASRHSEPNPESFANVARPGAYYERPRIKRDLPVVSSPWIGFAAFAAAGLTAWGLFLTYTTNQERVSSSVVRQILLNVRQNEQVRETIGESIRPEPTWYLNGDPWISGSINMLQGSVDISMRVKGSKSAGTLYFTSIRKDKGEPFMILRFKLICDDGTVLNLPAGLDA